VFRHHTRFLLLSFVSLTKIAAIVHAHQIARKAAEVTRYRYRLSIEPSIQQLRCTIQRLRCTIQWLRCSLLVAPARTVFIAFLQVVNHHTSDERENRASSNISNPIILIAYVRSLLVRIALCVTACKSHLFESQTRAKRAKGAKRVKGVKKEPSPR